jgi:hypothetical protein
VRAESVMVVECEADKEVGNDAFTFTYAWSSFSGSVIELIDMNNNQSKTHFLPRNSFCHFCMT